MKYALAFDMGIVYDASERFKKVNLDYVNKSLINDDNLRALCTFTMTFQDEAILKKFLIKNDGRLAKYSGCNLVLINLQKREFGRVIYSPDIKYFKFEDLAQLILKNVYDEKFLNQFCVFFQNKKYMQRYVFGLKGAVYESQPHVVYDAIRNLLCRACYDSKGRLNYNQLYNILSLILNIIEKMKYKSVEDDASKEREEEIKTFERPLTEEQQFEKEWLEERAALRKLRKW